ncbi:hypothetical protein KIW84_064900 [Lathyrus oleraceus]|uniref:Uncharacterized protein n=1 Tax=Pisum sativum TaxID=3888 RepID=A0A9D4WDZ2_PEA|nr:hypothetical protein KIW84_064900 [Pisum sativum]
MDTCMASCVVLVVVAGNGRLGEDEGRYALVVVGEMSTCMVSYVVVVGNGRQGEDEGRCALVVVEEMGTCKASCVVLVVEESGTLGVGEGRCEPVVVESGRLGVGEDRCELVEVEEMSNGMDPLVAVVSGPVVVVRNKNIGLLKFQMGN